jgi:DNA-binding transcriptional regulator YiaG
MTDATPHPLYLKRKALGLTQMEAAGLLGVPRTTYACWEVWHDLPDGRMPGPQSMQLIRERFGLSADDFLRPVQNREAA